MDDKRNSEEMQQPETPQPLYETVPVESAPTDLQPEELNPQVQGTDDPISSSQLQSNSPSATESEAPVYKEQSKLPILIGGVVVFFAVFLGIFVLLARNKGNTKQSIQPITLTYWGVWEEKEVMEPLIKEYEKKNPHITIIYEKKSIQDYRQKLITWIAQGQGPDLYRFHNTWLPEIQDIIAPLPDTVMSVAEFSKTFYPIHTKDLKIGQHIYGMPLMIDGLVLVSNNTLLKQAGIATAPTNWDDLIAAASKVTVKGSSSGDLITAGLAGGTATNVEHFSDLFGLMLLLNGGDLSKLDQPEATGALEAYRRLAEEPNNIWSDTMPNSLVAFKEGKVAMIIVPTWEIMSIKADAPDLSFTVSSIPYPPGGKQLSLASYWVEGVSKKSIHQAEAWNFLKFLASKEGQTKMYELQIALRPFGTAYSRVDLGDLLIQDAVLGPLIKQASEDRFVSLPLASNTYDNGLNDEVIRYIQNAINASAQGVSYSEALKTAKEGVTQLFSRYNIQ